MATTTTSGESSNSTAIIVLAIVVMAAIILGVVFMTSRGDNGSVMNAVKDAPAAVGNAADKTADKVTNP